jgi:hypothetical protein
VKHFEYVYFNIYAHYQQRNQDLTTFPARLWTMYIISMSIGGWVLFFQAAFLRLVRHAWFSTQSLGMSFAIFVYMSTALIFYRIFILNNYDEKIYNKYEPRWTNNPNKLNGLLVSILMVVAPYLLLLSLKIFFPGNHLQ